jgi:hypothetical protein
MRTDAGHPSSSHTPLFQGILTKGLSMEGSSGQGSEEPNRELSSHRRPFGNLPRKDQSDHPGGDAKKEVPKNRQQGNPSLEGTLGRRPINGPRLMLSEEITH